MNKLSAELFLELIADPAKYRVYLERIEAERKKLDEVIATVGKASELDSLRKQVEKEQADKNEEFEAKVKAAEARLEQRFLVAANAQKTADKTLAEANELLVQAQQKELQAKELAASFEGRNKTLRNNEELVKQRQAKLDSLIEDYNTKIAKLKSVMV